MISKIYIRTRPNDETISDRMLIDICDGIRKTGTDVLFDREYVDENTLILSLGGDGTMLGAMHLAAERDAYVTGFNYGHLGYLVPSSVRSTRELIQEIEYILYSVNTGDSFYKVNHLPLPILGEIDGEFKAINDFYFMSERPITYKISIDNADFFEFKSSGVVVSTPLGSTGLALSAGGSILSPRSGVLQITPVLAHSLTSRPLIIPDTSSIAIETDDDVEVHADGRYVGGYTSTLNVLQKTSYTIKMVQPKPWNFYDNLKQKMKWNA